MEDPPFPKTRDVLIQQLFFKIKYFQPNFVEKIVSSLTTDLNNQELVYLLTNDSLLEEEINKIVLVLDHDKKELLGSKLFQSVSLMEQELSAQVTGMLLELPVQVINELLDKPKDLEKAVIKAKREFLYFLKETESDEAPKKDSYPIKMKLPKFKEDIGEVLYEKLSPLYPESAAKLTGMLLQMELDELKCLLSNEALLNEKVKSALTVLK